MEENEILLSLRSVGESWLTSIHVTEEEALKLLNLSNHSLALVELPSVHGYAKVNELFLEIYYQDRKTQNIISSPLSDAHVVIRAAIEKAAEIRRSEAANSRIWDWVNERHVSTRVLTLTKGEQITALLLNNDNEYLAIQLNDGSTAIAQVSNEDEIPCSGSQIMMLANETGELFLRKI
jgi:hypothetical protein